MNADTATTPRGVTNSPAQRPTSNTERPIAARRNHDPECHRTRHLIIGSGSGKEMQGPDRAKLARGIAV